MNRHVSNVAEDMTKAGASQGHWRCACCFKKWTWANGGNIRLLILGETTVGGGFTNYQYAFLGAVDTQTQNKINFLKGAKLLMALGGRPLTLEN